MRCYEYDELNIPKKYKKMTLEQLERKGKFLEKIAIVVAKISSLHKKKNDTKVKFYI